MSRTSPGGPRDVPKTSLGEPRGLRKASEEPEGSFREASGREARLPSYTWGGWVRPVRGQIFHQGGMHQVYVRLLNDILLRMGTPVKSPMHKKSRPDDGDVGIEVTMSEDESHGGQQDDSKASGGKVTLGAIGKLMNKTLYDKLTPNSTSVTNIS